MNSKKSDVIVVRAMYIAVLACIAELADKADLFIPSIRGTEKFPLLSET